MEVVTARTRTATLLLATALLLALAIAASFLCDGVHSRCRRHHPTKHNSARPPSHAPGPSSRHASPSAPPPARTPSAAPMPGVSAPAPSDDDDDNVYDVMRDFGAAGDGVEDDTDAIKAAWDAACQDGGEGVVLAAAGRSFLVRSITFAGPCQGSVTLQIDGTIVAPSDPTTWPASSKRSWLVFYKADGMSMRGAGLIDGKGQKWWDLPCKPHKGGDTHGPCDSPVALRFFMSNNVTVQGLKVQNSPKFHFRFDGCRGVHVDGLSISSPTLSPNTDGIHVQNTQDVLIANTVVSNGDDCVSIGAGTLNVHIENITCGPGGHGISIGSLGKQGSRACVSNITVRNAVIRHSDNGVRIKTWQGGSGSVSAVTFDDVRMDTVRNPIIIDQYYCLTKSCKNSTTAVFVSDITYAGIRGTYDVRGGPPIHFGCSDAVPCTNITLSDVELLPASGDTVDSPLCWNVYGSATTPTVPPVACLMEGVPRNVEDNSCLKCY